MFDTQKVNPTNVVRVDIENSSALYAAYMPFIVNGGIFVNMEQLPSQTYMLGTDLYLLLHLKEENDRVPVHGKAVWVTGSSSGRWAGGVGVQFRDEGETKHRLETLLAGRLDSTTPTLTL